MAFRFDRGELRKPVRTEQGFLRVDGYVSRPGIYEYVNTVADEKDGLGKAGTLRRELRPDDEVFRVDSMAAFEGLPVTLYHPEKMVDATNAKALRVGIVTTGARRDGERAATSMVIDDPKAVAAVESGDADRLSPGYRIDEDRTPGVDPKYGRYDLVQRNIRPNHLALVKRARGGSDLGVRMDGESVGVERRDDWMEVSVDAAPVAVALTTVVEGHQHSLCVSDGGGSTSWATAEGAECPHAHEWIRGVDGKIKIAENAGHSHDVDNTTISVRNDAELDAGARDKLSDDDFADPDNRKLPINDKAHVIAAMGGHGFSDVKGWASAAVKKRAFDRIVAAAKKFDIDSSGFEKEYGAARADGGHMPDPDDKMEPAEQIGLLKVRLDAVEKQSRERTDALDGANKRADAAEAALKTSNERVGQLETKIKAGASALETQAIKTERERADAAANALDVLKESMPTLVRERCDSIMKATAIFGDEYRADGKTDREIRVDVIKKLRPKEDVSASVSDATIRSRCDSLVEDRMRTARSLASIEETVTTQRRSERADAADERQLTPDEKRRRFSNYALEHGPFGRSIHGGK